MLVINLLRIGTLAESGVSNMYRTHILKEELYGDILCEGAQGYWLDINQGNYPYVTSSYTLPYSACSLGFPPQIIRRIYGAAKIYDTRVGVDPDFPDSLLEDEILNEIAIKGNEFGTTTGRARKVNWLDLDRLIKAVNISGTTDIVISKLDVLEKIKVCKYYFYGELRKVDNIDELINVIKTSLINNCPLLEKIIFSNSPESIEGL